MTEFRHTIRDVMDAAAAKTGVEGWQAYRWSATDDGGSIVRGCVPSGTYTRGPRKGLPKFRPAVPGSERVIIVTAAELDAVAAAYEANGNCWACKGRGQTVARVHVDEGTTYRPCVKCSGTGLTGSKDAEPGGEKDG